ncbi:hypothetical protein JVX98_23365 [Ensifer sp. PDNC004]|uniref:hypothetical protein n=1 Tax=Ensifer sp. PDNC004 TaxID=2811423 RepID=UPI001964F2DC|nr:hypothetical protein [Ensifer sp. PDNC004]QRY67287.1 hypothetical protein JVX98_23365 [Ensifer sp. PDNC004]
MDAETENAFWAKIQVEFGELRDLFSMHFETQAEGIGQRIATTKTKSGRKSEWRDTAPHWHDEEVGQSVRSWQMIPYVDAIDQELLCEHFEAGRRLIPQVEQGIAARKMTFEFFEQWGSLNRCGGAVRIVYFARPDVGRLREGSDNLAAHRRWFAHQFLKARVGKSKSVAMDEMEEFVNATIVRLDGGERVWFARFLSEKEADSRENARRLTKAFMQNLSISDMQKLDRAPWDGVPEFARKISYP